MGYISCKIEGTPYGRAKRQGKVEAPAQWTEAIRKATGSLPKVKEACVMKITFLLPPDKFPTDFPCGPGLDNLLKRFLGALNETIFSEAPGKDSCVVALNAMKTRVEGDARPGALLEVMPVSLA